MEDDVKIKHKKSRYQSPTAWILSLCFIVSLGTLILYILDLNFDEPFLFFLLTIIRYSSFLVFICSFYKIVLNLYRFIIKRRKFRFLKMLIYFLLLIYGACFFMLEALIIVISGGNV